LKLLSFVKMQAQGNDFIILDGLLSPLPRLSHQHIIAMCHRHTGIGCDQMLVLSKHESATAQVTIYNADGSTAANCGNGLRCVGDYLMNKLALSQVSLALQDRWVKAKRVGDAIEVDMGKAIVEVDTQDYVDIHIGNPHRVFFADYIANPDKNVEIISEHRKEQAVIRIFERGVGETLACGSGACATAAAIWSRAKLVAPLTIHMPGGSVEVSGTMDHILLRGSVAIVFSGEYLLS